MKPTRLPGALLSAVGFTWFTRTALDLRNTIGAARSRIRPYAAASPHYADLRFRNTEDSSSFTPGIGLIKDVVLRGRAGRPPRDIPLAALDTPAEAAAAAVTWFGHSSVLIEIDGRRILTDPVWSNRASPSPLVGPARLHPVPAPLQSLPALDAVVISHDHYDHLDRDTILSLAADQQAPFIVPVGVGAHLRHWGIAEDRIIELDWDASCSIAGITVTCTEARHFSGRGLIRDTTQWASWAFAGPSHRVFFGGDTGYTPAFGAIGEKHGPFDLTLLPVGAYNEQWRDIHMDPEEAVRAHVDLQRGDPSRGIVVPVHWATFNLAFHTWAEPIERLIAECEVRGVTAVVPMPGGRVDAAMSDRSAADFSPPWWQFPATPPQVQ